MRVREYDFRKFDLDKAITGLSNGLLRVATIGALARPHGRALVVRLALTSEPLPIDHPTRVARVGTTVGRGQWPALRANPLPWLKKLFDKAVTLRYKVLCMTVRLPARGSPGIGHQKCD